jgi:hypothetical protein
MSPSNQTCASNYVMGGPAEETPRDITRMTGQPSRGVKTGEVVKPCDSWIRIALGCDRAPQAANNTAINEKAATLMRVQS